MEKERIAFLDYVRVFACFLVMLVHASENYYPGPGATDMAGPQAILANQTDRLWVSLYDGFSRISVPLFIIVSAYLLAPKKKEQSAREFYRKRFGKILPPFLIFTVLYCTLPLLWGQIDTATSLRDLARIPINFPTLAGHFWFMFPLFSLYLFIPVVSPWLESASAREERFFILLFLISSCMPFLRRWFGELWGECFWNEYHLLWYFSGYLGYLVLAHYIRKHLDWGVKKRLIVGALLLVAGSAVTIWSYYVQAVPGVVLDTTVLEVGWRFCTLNVVCATTGAFLLFSCIGLNDSAADGRETMPPKWLESLSKMSYGMFLMHIFWLHMWTYVSMQMLQLPTVASIPFIAVCTFVSSALCTKLISLLPGSKWVVGC
ncbi:MAG: acyltransferase [Spirochaetia bacterium]|nr:acyltransferase [Spirochaetia bacterium]